MARGEIDLPAEMCDEVIPGKDFVFMTGATLANNTATHLLELCRSSSGTKAIFVGPTTTLSEILFEFGATELAGTVIGEIAFIGGLASQAMATSPRWRGTSTLCWADCRHSSNNKVGIVGRNFTEINVDFTRFDDLLRYNGMNQ